MIAMTPRFSSRATCVAFAALLVAAPLGAQGSPDTTLTTRSGIFTAEQAAKGKEIHGAACLSCHKPVEHTGKFWSDKVNTSLGALFGYIKSEMPQDNPGSLAADDYANILAFILQLNAMPAGEKPLPGDSTALARIRVVPPDTTRKGPGQ
jgi:hypothetical protein